MTPHMILLIRHAEKPVESTDINLSPAGQARAKQLAPYIPQTFGKPDFLFAAAASKDSVRPIETIQPLSKALDIPIDDSIADKDFTKLAKQLVDKDKYSGKFVLICWHHGEIPGLAQALGAPTGAYPNPWPPSVFNLMLQFSFDANGHATVEQIEEPF